MEAPGERFAFDAPAEVVLAGDVMQESFLYYRDLLRESRESPCDVHVPDAFILCTLHRQENTDDPGRLRAIVDALNTAAGILPVVLPLHPRTRMALTRSGFELTRRVVVTETVSYLNMVRLLDSCRLVVTDSGGLQKEAYFARKPCLTLRTETEWVETVRTGWNRLCDVEHEALADCVAAVLAKGPRDADYQPDLYGTPTSSNSICRHLLLRMETGD